MLKSLSSWVKTLGIRTDLIKLAEFSKKSLMTTSRSLIVIDPRRTETADLADHWLQVKPGTGAFLLAALGRYSSKTN